VIVDAPLEETWARLRALAPLRDDRGLAVLEEADDDTRTATLRFAGQTVVVALEPAGTSTDVRTTPPVIDDLLASALGANPFRLVAASAAAADLAARRRR
jgi:hypothetical protein